LVETINQLRMTQDWRHASEALIFVAPGCWTKFFGIALHALGCSAICLWGERKRAILGVLGVLPIFAVSADALRVLPAPWLMSVAFGAFWIALLAAAIAETVRARGASG